MTTSEKGTAATAATPCTIDTIRSDSVESAIATATYITTAWCKTVAAEILHPTATTPGVHDTHARD